MYVWYIPELPSLFNPDKYIVSIISEQQIIRILKEHETNGPWRGALNTTTL
jgi:hypothetical protein